MLMEETLATEAIILRRRPFRERDSLLNVFTLDHGKKDLVVRGTQNIRSKLAGHIEPLTLLDIMIVKGRGWDYLAAASTKEAFLNIRRDLNKVDLASRAVKIYIKYLQLEQEDKDYFFLLADYLKIIDVCPAKETLYYSFLLKFMSIAGFKPELYHCLGREKQIIPGRHFFDISQGGLSHRQENDYALTISENCVKIMRIVLKKDFSEIIRIKTEKALNKEFESIVKSFFNYNFN